MTKEIEQKVKLELQNEKLQEQLNTFEATEFEETKAPSSLSMKLNVNLISEAGGTTHRVERTRSLDELPGGRESGRR